ncbi:hypothetical protein H1Q63_36370 [Desmonostoc muscorum CCALA 125]|nr:hypothetical protein [Desmonostoc muscorum CCALA 125]
MSQVKKALAFHFCFGEQSTEFDEKKSEFRENSERGNASLKSCDRLVL